MISEPLIGKLAEINRRPCPPRDRQRHSALIHADRAVPPR